MSRNIYTAVNWAKAIALDDSHGYSQSSRLGPDYDCSSFVATALQQGGFAIDPSSTWTGNMFSVLTALGFTSVPISDTRKLGHIFLSHDSDNQHCVMCIDANQIVHASSDHGYPQTGDQTGTEICITNYYNPSSGSWNYHLVPPADSYNNNVPTAQWYAKPTGYYARTSNEAFNNAIMMFNILIPIGWTVNALSAILGNMEFVGNTDFECGYNPWRWKDDVVLSSSDPIIDTSSSNAYGLLQFTPAGKYIHSPYAMADSDYAPNFSDVTGNANDGSSQIRFLDAHGDYIPTQTYPMSYADFKSSTQSADYLASVWLYNYKRLLNPSATEANRKAAANYWFGILENYVPTRRKKMPLWMMLNPFI